MSLSFSDTLTIIGLIATIIFGIWGIKAAIRQNYPGKISLVEENSLSLFNSIVRNFPEITIQYNDSLLNEQLIYVKESLVNVGSIDLSTKNSNYKLRCTAINGLEWVDAKITSKSENVECSVAVYKKNLEFDFDLLRKNEFFQFEALLAKADLEQTNDLSRELFKFTHRIPNTSDVKLDSLVSKEQIALEEFNYKFRLGLFSFMLLSLGAFIIYNTFFDQYRLVYEYLDNGLTNTVNVTPSGDNKLIIKGLESDLEKMISLSEFNNNTIVKASVIKKQLSDFSYMIFLFVITLIMTIGQATYDIMRLKRAKKIIKILEKEEVKSHTVQS